MSKGWAEDTDGEHVLVRPQLWTMQSSYVCLEAPEACGIHSVGITTATHGIHNAGCLYGDGCICKPHTGIWTPEIKRELKNIINKFYTSFMSKWSNFNNGWNPIFCSGQFHLLPFILFKVANEKCKITSHVLHSTSWAELSWMVGMDSSYDLTT